MLDTTLDYNFMSVPRKQDEGKIIYQISDGSNIVVKYPEVKQRIPNYCDPYIDSKYKGYQRDEIYRFGIIFLIIRMSLVLFIGQQISNSRIHLKYLLGIFICSL